MVIIKKYPVNHPRKPSIESIHTAFMGYATRRQTRRYPSLKEIPPLTNFPLHLQFLYFVKHSLNQ